MNAIGKRTTKLNLLLALALACAGIVEAQAPGAPQPPQPPGQSPGVPAAPPTADSTPAPVSAEEDGAIKDFREASNDDQAKKDQMGQDFVQKFPDSRYRAEIYAWQVRSYMSRNMVDKMEAAGEKSLELNPNDPQTLALLGMTLPRAMNASTPEAEKDKRLAKSEKYCQKALDLLPTISKPANVADDAFQAAKSQTAAFAYSGLGMVDVRRNKFADAIPNFEKSVRMDPQPDPVNYYLLGISNEKTSHFDDAVSAFTKCAAIPGGIQATCTKSSEEAKKLAATQMSTPK